MFSPPADPHGGPNNQIPKQICAQGSLLNIYVYFLFLEPFVSQKIAKNQYVLLLKMKVPKHFFKLKLMLSYLRHGWL